MNFRPSLLRYYQHSIGVLIGNKIQTNQEVLPAFIEDEDDSSYRTSTFINKEEADNQLTKYNLTLRSKDNKSEIMIKDYDSMNAQDEEN